MTDREPAGEAFDYADVVPATYLTYGVDPDSFGRGADTEERPCAIADSRQTLLGVRTKTNG